MKRVLAVVGVVAVLGVGAFVLRPDAPASRPEPLPAEEREALQQELREDPTLGPSLQAVTREQVMGLKRLSPEQKERLWARVQRYQAASRSTSP